MINLTTNTTLSATIMGGVYDVSISGTFGGGTVTLFQSYDGGKTLLPVQSDSTTAGSPATPTITGNTILPIVLGDGLFYGVMTGATSPNVVIRGNAISVRALNF